VLGVSVGQQGQVPGPLDGTGELMLVLGAIARLAPPSDLALLGDVALKRVYVLVVNLLDLVHAESTHTPAGEVSPLHAATTPLSTATFIPTCARILATGFPGFFPVSVILYQF
jgi:hypothetical protein